MLSPAFGPEDPLNLGDPVDVRFRQYNFDICTAIDLTKLHIVLDKMVVDGWCDKQMALIYRKQAESLLAAIRSENARCHTKARQENSDGR